MLYVLYGAPFPHESSKQFVHLICNKQAIRQMIIFTGIISQFDFQQILYCIVPIVFKYKYDSSYFTYLK